MPGHEVSLATISPVLFAAVQDDIGMRIWPQLQAVWPLIEYRGLRDAFVIRYRVGEQESLRLHQDIGQVSATVRLNDGYEGAALAFPRQGYDNSAQPIGSLLAWPSLVTHPHEATRLTQRRQVRAHDLVRTARERRRCTDTRYSVTWRARSLSQTVTEQSHEMSVM